MAGSVLRTLPRSPTLAPPNQDGVSPEASFWEASRTGVFPVAELLVLRC
jgi:hypothetical protein